MGHRLFENRVVKVEIKNYKAMQRTYVNIIDIIHVRKVQKIEKTAESL